MTSARTIVARLDAGIGPPAGRLLLLATDDGLVVPMGERQRGAGLADGLLDDLRRSACGIWRGGAADHLAGDLARHPLLGKLGRDLHLALGILDLLGDVERRAVVDLPLGHPLQLARGDPVLDLLGQVERAHPGADRVDFDADPLGDDVPADVLVRVARAKLLAELRLLDGREILALDVLDEVDLHHLVVVVVADDHRDLVQAGLLRRAVAPLADDDLVVAS